MIPDDYRAFDQHDAKPETKHVAAEFFRIGLTLSLLLILPAIVLLLLLPRGSAEFTITLLTLGNGLVLLAFAGFLYWLAVRHD